jgi:outer membrane immunogenic protein
MKSLRRVFLATASSVALVGSAAAQPPAPIAMSWAGPYMGLNFGVAWNNARFTDTQRFAFPVGANDPFWTPSQSGFTFGGQAGYNLQSGNFVYGIEADVNSVGSKGNASLAGFGTVLASTSFDWMATARGRLGYAFSQFLVYGTGGLAVARFSDAYGFVGNEFSNTVTRAGWTAGGGLEYMLSRNSTVRFEWLYSDFGSYDQTIFIFGGNYTSTFKHTVTTARAALNWKW